MLVDQTLPGQREFQPLADQYATFSSTTNDLIKDSMVIPVQVIRFLLILALVILIPL
jgi:hypothetical protein